MRKLQLSVYYILYFFLGCIDYVYIEQPNKNGSYPPSIDASHLSPLPSRLVDPINVGRNCPGQIFKIPPIEDRDENDSLHYLWFIDNKLALQPSEITKEVRATAIVTFTIDQQMLLNLFGPRLPADFNDRLHLVEFYVSDVEYSIPETRCCEQGGYSDYAYWIVRFSDEPCSVDI